MKLSAILLPLFLSAVAEGKDGVVAIKEDGKTLVEYKRQGFAFKPYVLQLYSPSGVAVLRDSTKGHKHHHGLMFAVKANGINFWVEKNESGKQRELGFREDGSGFSQELAWVDSKGTTLIRESRTLVLGKTAKATLLTWRSKLRAQGKDKVTLTGTHYHGLGMRFVADMDRTGTLVFSDDVPSIAVRGSEKLSRVRWCAYSAKAKGKPVTVALFDSPGNPCPALMFSMIEPFAYLSATLNLSKKPLVIEPGKSLGLTYGVAVFDGKKTREEINVLYEEYLKMKGVRGRRLPE